MQIKGIDQDLDAVTAYDYDLPEGLIAAHPAPLREGSRLLVADRERGTLLDGVFTDLENHLRPGDLLVFNDTQVVPGRILTVKATGGRVELLVTDVLSPEGDDRWQAQARGSLRLECMTRSSKRLREGMRLTSLAGEIVFTVVACEPGEGIVEVEWAGTAMELLERCGRMPLPPYIVQRRVELGDEEVHGEDEERYQTVYARRPGAIAAPTAGLHFSEALLTELEAMGVRRAYVTLTVGPGTFKPVKTERLSEHPMHSEEYLIDAHLQEAIAEARAVGGRVIAVGTTSMRALEAEARRDRPFEPGLRQTDIFLKPGGEFKVCEGLITNFHLPRSTLLALVAAFVGYPFMREIYSHAIDKGYRFYSYGDASLLL